MTVKKRDLALFGSSYSISRAMKDSGAISESASPTQSAHVCAKYFAVGKKEVFKCLATHRFSEIQIRGRNDIDPLDQ
jgi:hypothetical protein